jgi:hypothetical protein
VASSQVIAGRHFPPNRKARRNRSAGGQHESTSSALTLDAARLFLVGSLSPAKESQLLTICRAERIKASALAVVRLKLHRIQFPIGRSRQSVAFACTLARTLEVCGLKRARRDPGLKRDLEVDHVRRECYELRVDEKVAPTRQDSR